MANQDKRATSRREFFANLFMGGGLLMAAVTFLRDLWLYLYPDLGRRRYTKYMVAKTRDIPVGKARRLLVGRVPLYVVHLEDGFRVFSGICTHLGCLVKWEEAKQRFYCPCHKGIFAPDGSVVGGPPPRPLDEYRVSIENELVFITIEQRQGRWS